MKTKYLSGQPVADKIYSGISAKVKKLLTKNITPKLAAILVGDHPASKIYIQAKCKEKYDADAKIMTLKAQN